MRWSRFNQQFAETSHERSERMRAARRAAKCKFCGVGNDKIGTPHADGCARSTKAAAAEIERHGAAQLEGTTNATV